MPRYRRILLKLSGEALQGQQGFGIDPNVLLQLAAAVAQLHRRGVELALVLGGGNLFRGERLAEAGIDRVTGDHMGMLATVMNALAFQDTLERRFQLPCRLLSAIKMNEICEDFVLRRAVRHLEKGRIVIFAAGTGNPFFTTDTAASLRAIEIGADILIKATKVDGIYDQDPLRHPNARRYDTLTYQEVLSQNLKVMDTTAFVLCRDHGLPLCVLNIFADDALARFLDGEAVGTLIES